MNPIYDPYVGYRSFYSYTPPTLSSVLALFVVLGIAIGACSSSDTSATDDPVPTTTTTESAPTTSAPPAPEAARPEGAEAIVASLVPPGSPGAIVRVDIGGSTVLETAAGEVAIGSGQSLTAQHPFRLGDTTKPITAATVLRLQEQGHLNTDDSIAEYLPAELIAELHVVDGVSRGADITIRQLLGHTSGLADRASDTAFIQDVVDDPGRVWQPRELVEYGITNAGHRFEPGAEFHYSDDGYVLLGMIIEATTGQPLHEVYRQQVLDPLGMSDTYLEGHETARGPELSHPYLGELDAIAVHPSIDWGGGGLVSTVGDLVRFGTALTDGTLFEEAATLEEMVHDPGTGYGLGITIESVAGLTILRHDGGWGSSLQVVPELGAVMAGTINQVTDETTMQVFFETVADLVLAEQEVTLPRPDGVLTVEIDGRTHGYLTRGQGEPTIVFESGGGSDLGAWVAVLDGAAGISSVFAYDRAGWGDSDLAEGPRDGQHIVEDLHALLAASGQRPPYVLVGHSMGGAYSQLFARTYPDEVVGLVIVDGTPPSVLTACPASEKELCDQMEEQANLQPEPGRSEALGHGVTGDQVRAAPPLGPIPAVVIAASRDEGPVDQAQWIESLRQQAAELNATFVLAEESGHFVQFDQPEVVLDAIQMIVDQSQTPSNE